MSAKHTEGFVEDVEVRGHIIDSLILPRVLDCITQGGGSFTIKNIVIGHGRHDPSLALLQVRAESRETLDEILAQISDHGAVPTVLEDCQLLPVDMPGAFPEGFYCTTNQQTQVRLHEKWIDVAEQEMDCGIVVDESSATARCVPMTEVVPGMKIVIGHMGIRVFPYQREAERQSFEFMNSSVSTEKPKAVAVRQVARQLLEMRDAGKKTALVGGPAIVHTGSVDLICDLIRKSSSTYCWPATPWRRTTLSNLSTGPAWGSI